MEYTTFSTPTFHGGAITRPHEKTFYAKLSADLHTKHTATRQALEDIYQEALISGAGKYDRTTFLGAINELGAAIDVSAVQGVVTFTLRATAEAAPKLLKLFATMIEAPTFATKELARIKKQLHNELIAYEEEARSIAVDMLTDTLYEKTDRRYVDTPKIEREQLAHVTPAALKRLHRELRQTTWTVTVGSTPTLVSKLKNIIAGLIQPAAATPRVSIHAPRAAAPKLVLHSIPSKQNIEFSIGGLLPLTLHDPEYLPFVFGLNVLGKWGGFTGRLMSTVREKEGLTYSIYARTETVSTNEYGYWRIMTFFAPDKVKQGVTSTLREIAAIHDHGITKSEHERFQTILATQQALLKDSLPSAVNDFHGYLFNNFNIEEMEAKKAALLAVTRAEVNAALKQHLDPTKLVICGAGPITSVKKELAAAYRTT